MQLFHYIVTRMVKNENAINNCCLNPNEIEFEKKKKNH